MKYDSAATPFGSSIALADKNEYAYHHRGCMIFYKIWCRLSYRLVQLIALHHPRYRLIACRNRSFSCQCERCYSKRKAFHKMQKQQYQPCCCFFISMAPLFTVITAVHGGLIFLCCVRDSLDPISRYVCQVD